MKKLVSILATGFLCSFGLSNSIFSQLDYQNAIGQAEQIIKKVMEEKALPGVAVAVSIEGNTIWSKGFGFADMEEKIPVSASDSKFRIGSVSKPLTAVGLAILYEQGKVDLDAPIQNYVPDFPKKRWDISLRQLAGHTAGIRHYRGNEFMSDKKYPTVAEGLDIFENDRLEFEPGTKYSYSSYAWNLISAAIENIAEEPFLKFMDKEVFNKMELKNTEADHADEENAKRTKFYQRDGGEASEAPYVDNSYKWAGGGFLSTAEDMVIFGNSLLFNQFLKKETLDLFISPQKIANGKTTNYGIGFRSGEDKKGRKWYGHSGGSVGGTTMWMIFPDQEMIVAMITNMSSAAWNDLPFRVANQFLSVN